jgi:hypothetical protein
MSDWLGLLFFALLIIGVYFALRTLANPKKRTVEDFERGIEEGTGLAGAGMNALKNCFNPKLQKALKLCWI